MKDPAKRRELKIQQYRKEKELRAQIEVRSGSKSPPNTSKTDGRVTQTLRKRRSQLPSSEPTTDFDLIASLLPSGANSQPSEDDEPDADTDELLRDATLLLLRLTFAQAYAHLESMNQELELLRSAPFLPPMPAPPPEDGQRGRAKEDEDMWRLDRPAASGGPDGRGPLMDSGGKVRGALIPESGGELILGPPCSSRYVRSPSSRPVRAPTARGCRGKCSALATGSRP